MDMVNADKTIKDLETETGKQLNEEERKVIEGFTAFMNMLWNNQERKKDEDEKNDCKGGEMNA